MRWPWNEITLRGIEKEENKEEELNLKSKSSYDSSWVIDSDSISDTSSGEENNGCDSRHCVRSALCLDVGASVEKLSCFDAQRNSPEGLESYLSSLLGSAGKLHEKLSIHRLLPLFRIKGTTILALTSIATAHIVVTIPHRQLRILVQYMKKMCHH